MTDPEPIVHEPAGAEWDGMVCACRCSCGWLSDPVAVGRMWIENLNAQYQAHLEEVGAA